jgi:excisionase family DNA binding protein
MVSVTQRIKETKQPYGGYLPTACFKTTKLHDNLLLNTKENIHPTIVGLAVDYLTRFKLEKNIYNAFDISLKGAKLIGMQNKALKLINNIYDLDDNSIINACKLSGFDVCYRASPSRYKPVEEINPNFETIENIRIMVNRSLLFFKTYGPVICSGVTFEGGYTDVVDAGDGDYITQDTLWDFKVSATNITSKHTLQILMYYIMGIHSSHKHFQSIKKIGFYNPRLNMVYVCEVCSVSSSVIKVVENDVLCYTTKKEYHSKRQEKDLTVIEACAITGFEKNLIYKDIRNGILPAYKKTNKYYISKQELENYIDKKRSQRNLAVVLCIIGILIYFISIIIVFSV